jgi:acyl carrier protein
MAATTTIERLKDTISEHLDVRIERDEIDTHTPLFEDGLGLDSVVLVELIALVEKTFDIKFSDDELNPESFCTVAVLADVVEAKLALPI